MFSIFFFLFNHICKNICIWMHIYGEAKKQKNSQKENRFNCISDYVPCIFRLYILEGDIHVTLLFCTTHNMWWSNNSCFSKLYFQNLDDSYLYFPNGDNATWNVTCSELGTIRNVTCNSCYAQINYRKRDVNFKVY